ncbi:hypothetical protein [Deinococcus sedimenti]|uniref:CdiI immunity protein domain-containing protein n=1 Tax=Deinococcus sedimenti TaxID=1867090 RepID=A0ABQ2S9X0_9DEIO|nr:hypothetical protein [Deinococcus sedimenti]GGS05202.1 hypothetical protein GCM10008960_34700 [Deinococcus sedimenti]
MSIPDRLAYLSMFAFLEAYSQRTGSDEIGALLGDLQLDSVDEPFDPAVLQDWTDAVARAREDGEALARAHLR